MPTQTTDTGDAIMKVVYEKKDLIKRSKYRDLCDRNVLFKGGRQVKKDKLLFSARNLFFVAGNDLRLDRPAFYQRHSNIFALCSSSTPFFTYQEHHDSRRL